MKGTIKFIADRLMFYNAPLPYMEKKRLFDLFKQKKPKHKYNKKPSMFDRIMMRKGCKRCNRPYHFKLWPVQLHRYMGL
jgi:hypothetical protein